MQVPLQITVRDMAGLGSARPVSGGVPVAEGCAPAGSVFGLADARGKEVPVKSKIHSSFTCSKVSLEEPSDFHSR